MSSVERMFTLIEQVARDQEQGLTFPELLDKTGFPNSTLFRLLRLLTDLRYLTYVPETRKYFLSFKFAAIGARITGSHAVSKAGHPFLETLFAASGHTCSLGVLDQDRGVYVDVLTTTRYGMKMLAETGRLFALHCTGIGKIFLAHMPPARRRALLALPLERVTENTRTDAAELEKGLQDVLEQGYAIDDEEAFRGMVCFAAPICDLTGQVIAGVSVSCPTFTVETDTERQRLIALVKQCAAEISRAFGHLAQNS